MKASSQEQGVRSVSNLNQPRSRSWLPPVTLAAGVLVAFHALTATAIAAGVDFCRQTSQNALRSCQAGARSDYQLALGKCRNLSDPAARTACRQPSRPRLRSSGQARASPPVRRWCRSCCWPVCSVPGSGHARTGGPATG